jgi:hypothetical protein
MKLTKPQSDNYLKALIYGAYGAGKTYLAATAVESVRFRDVLFLDFEAGTRSLARKEFDDIDIITLTQFTELAQVYEFLRRHVSLRDKTDDDSKCKLEDLNKMMGLSPKRRYRTVIVDSLTEIHKLALYHLQSINPDTTPLDADLPYAELRDWGRAAEAIRLLVRALRNLEAHVIIICAQQRAQDETGRFVYSPALSGKLSSEIQGFVDIVGLLKSSTDKEGKTKRRLYVAPAGNYDAKDRIHGDGVVYFENPTIPRILTGNNDKKEV